MASSLFSAFPTLGPFADFGTVAGNNVAPWVGPDGAPYDPSTLSLPLTPVQLGRIQVWLEKELVLAGKTWKHKPVTPADWLTAYTDLVNEMLRVQDKVKNGPGSSIPGLSGIEAIGAFFNKLGEPQTWVRIAEFTAGGILLVVGMNAMLKSNSAYRATKSTVKKAIPL